MSMADGIREAEPPLRKFRIRVERFAGGGSKVVTVRAVNRASAWSLAAAKVDDPDDIWRMTMLRDNGRRLRTGLDLPDGEPDFHGGVPVDEAVEQAHAPRLYVEQWPSVDVRGLDQASRLYRFDFFMFTEVIAGTFAYARNRTEAWSMAAFEEAVGQISALWLTDVGATTVGHRPDWLGDPDEDERVTWDGEQLRIYEDIPYGGVTADLTDADGAIDIGSILMMRQRAEETERREEERRMREIPNLVGHRPGWRLRRRADGGGGARRRRSEGRDRRSGPGGTGDGGRGDPRGDWRSGAGGGCRRRPRRGRAGHGDAGTRSPWADRYRDQRNPDGS